MSYLLANGCSFTNKNYNTHSHGFAHSIEEKKIKPTSKADNEENPEKNKNKPLTK